MHIVRRYTSADAKPIVKVMDWLTKSVVKLDIGWINDGISIISIMFLPRILVFIINDFNDSICAGNIFINVVICFVAIIRTGTKKTNNKNNIPVSTIPEATGRLNFLHKTSTRGFNEHAKTYDAKNNIAIPLIIVTNFITNIATIKNIIFFIVK